MKQTSQPTVYNRTAVFVAACIGMCFFGVSMIALGSVLPSLTEQLCLDDAQKASLTITLPLGMLAGSLIFGPVVDRFGHKMMLVGNCLIVLLGVAAIAVAGGMPLLRLGVAAIGFGGGVLNGETNALVSDIYEGGTRNSRLSFLGVFYGLGALVLPSVMTAAGTASYATALWWICGAMAVGVIACMFMRFPAPKQPQGFPLRDAAKVITSPVMIILAFVLFFQSGTEGITNNWTTTFLEQRGYTNADRQIALSAMLVGLTAARLLQGVLFTRLDGKRVMFLSLGMAVAGYVMLAAAPSTFTVACAMVLIGAGLAATFPVVLGILGERFAALSGTAFSVALAVALCGQTVLNFTTGLIAEGPGIEAFPWEAVVAVAMMFALMALYSTVTRNKKQTNK